MKELIIAALIAINFLFSWALYDSWQRNNRLADMNAHQYMTTYHLNERIGTLKMQLNDIQGMCEQVMEDAGMFIFKREG